MSILRRRLEIPNQTDVVKAELLLALRALGRGGVGGGGDAAPGGGGD